MYLCNNNMQCWIWSGCEVCNRALTQLLMGLEEFDALNYTEADQVKIQLADFQKPVHIIFT